MQLQGWKKISLLLFSSIISIKPDSVFALSTYYLQAASFHAKAKAEKTLLHLEHHFQLKGKIHPQRIQGEQYYQVWLGPYKTLAHAHKIEHTLVSAGENVFVRKTSYPSSSEVSSLPYQPTAKPKANTDIAKRQTLPERAPSSPEPLPSEHLFVPLLPYQGRGILDGTLAQITNFVDGEFLQPVFPLEEGFAYVDGAGKYGEDTAWFLSVGAGVRKIIGQQLWGAYLFGDYNESIRDSSFWVLNPGLEFMSAHWDGVINGYFPVSPQQKSFGVFPGFELGIPSTHFSNHTVFEDFYNVVDATGPGVDAQIGYTLDRFYNVRGFIGSYYFNPKQEGNFVGVEGGLEVPLTQRFTVVVHDAYDRVQGNTFMGTLRLTLDFNPFVNTLHHRLFDPIRRHLGAQQTGAGIPITQSTVFVGERATDVHAWFFAPGGTIFNLASGFANCTYENPCGEFSQDAITGINTLSPQASLLLNTGTYNNPLVGTGLTLFSGQKLLGRMDYFRQAALGAVRPLINDTLLLPGYTQVENVQINGNSTISGSRVGVSILPGSAGPIVLKNSAITTVVNGVALSGVGLLSQNNTAALLLTNSTINTTVNNSLTEQALGISLSNNGGITTLVGDDIQVYSSNNTTTAGVITVNSPVNIIATNINVYGNNGNIFALNMSSNRPKVNVIASRLTALASNNTAATGQVSAVVNAGGYLQVLNSALSVYATDYASMGSLITLDTGSGATNNITSSIINVIASNSGGYVTGINAVNATSNLKDSTVNALLNHTGFSSFNYGINAGADSKTSLDGVNVSLIAQNVNGPLIALENGGELTIGNTRLLTVGPSTANADTYNGVGSVVATFGYVTCVLIVNGTPHVATCPA